MKDFVDFITENYENIFEKLDLGQKSGISSEADIDLHKLEHIFKTFLDDQHAHEGKEWAVDSGKFVPISKRKHWREMERIAKQSYQR